MTNPTPGVKTKVRQAELEPHEVERWAHSTTTGSVGRKAVLQYLAARADERGSCFPGQQTIGRATEQGERTVRRHLADMAEAGLLCHRARSRQDGRGRTSDRYFLHVGAQCARPDCPSLAHDQPANLAGRTTTNRPNGNDQPATGGRGGNSQSLSEELPVGADLARPAKPCRTRSTQKPRVQFPDDWGHTIGHADIAFKYGLDLVAERDQFEDHHRAKGSTMVDWDRAFNTWLRNAAKWSTPDKKLTAGGYIPKVTRYVD